MQICCSQVILILPRGLQDQITTTRHGFDQNQIRAKREMKSQPQVKRTSKYIQLCTCLLQAGHGPSCKLTVKMTESRPSRKLWIYNPNPHGPRYHVKAGAGSSVRNVIVTLLATATERATAGCFRMGCPRVVRVKFHMNMFRKSTASPTT